MTPDDQHVADAWVQRLLEAHDAGAEDAWTRFDHEPTSRREAVVLALKQRVDELVRNTPAQALPVADALVRAARDLPGLAALAHRGRGTARHFNGDPSAGAEDFERAAHWYDEQDEPVEAARTRRSLVEVLDFAGRADEALACADRARRTLVEHDETLLLAQLEVNVGNVHTRRDDYPTARDHYAAARAAFERLDDEVGVAFSDFNLGVIEMNANRCDEAEQRWRSARSGMGAAGMGLLVADCDYNLAYLESRRGRYELAVEGLTEARRTYERHGKPSGLALCDLDLAEIHLRLHADRDAHQRARSAVEAFSELGMEYELARAEVLVALAEARLGDPLQAQTQLRAAEDRFDRLGNTSYAAFVRLHRAALSVGRGPTHAVVTELTASRTALLERGMRWLADLATVVMARAVVIERPEEALAALHALRDDRDGSRLDELLEVLALRIAADACRALGRDEEALAALRAAVTTIDEAYAHVPGQDIRMAFFRDQHPAFVDLALMLADAGRAADALVVLERGRARSSREALPSDGGGASAAWHEARARLDWLLTRRLDDELGVQQTGHELRRHPRPAELQREIESARDELQTLAQAQRSTGRAPSHDAVDLPRLAAGRRGDEILLAYASGPQGVVVFIGLPDGEGLAVDVLPLAVGEDRLRELRERFLFQVERLHLEPRHAARYEGRIARSLSSLLGELGRLLLAPVFAHLGPAAEGRPLLVVPYGPLHDLPFHAFELDGTPVITRHELSYGPSLWALALARRGAAATDDRGLVWASGAVQVDLPEIEREIDDLSRVYARRFRRLDPAELVSRLQGREIGGRLLHVAGHARFEAERPRFSAVCLGSSFLLAHDIAHMHLDFDIVTLSGCETGRSRRVGGEELLGLPGAILAAGAKTVVATQWAVDDGLAARFMRRMHGLLAAGQGARRATAIAQRELLPDAPHALAWAAFAVQGDPDRHAALQPAPSGVAP